MAQDFEKLYEELKSELGKLAHEMAEMRTRLARLEEERAEKAAESLESSF